MCGGTLRLPPALTVSARTGLIRGPSCGGQVAQLVEQRTENPRVGGSIPPLATSPYNSNTYNPILVGWTVPDTRTASTGTSHSM